jgi:hypothetical protein
MFFAICKWVIISLTLIFLSHHLYVFLMDTLTVPKIKDLVNKPTEQYRDIFETLQRQPAHETSDTSMTEELSTFLNELKKAPSPVQDQTQGQSQLTQGHTTSNDFMAANEMIGGFSSF